MARTDVAGLDEVVQKLPVRRLKVLISTIGPGHSEQNSFRNPKITTIGKTNWTDCISLPWLFKKKSREKLENCVPPNVKTIRKAQNPTMQGREGGRRQVTLCCHQTTVHFSVAIDRENVSAGIVRALRDGWRTINCAVFVTDERSALSLCPAEDRTNLVAVRIRCVSVLRTHSHMYPRSSALLDV